MPAALAFSRASFCDVTSVRRSSIGENASHLAGEARSVVNSEMLSAIVSNEINHPLSDGDQKILLRPKSWSSDLRRSTCSPPQKWISSHDSPAGTSIYLRFFKVCIRKRVSSNGQYRTPTTRPAALR